MDPMENERDIDRWLESALSQYGKAEPRTGLENRILANVQANRIAARRRWWWMAGMATSLAALLAVVWVVEHGRERSSESTGRATTARRDKASGSNQPEPAPQIARSTRTLTQHRRTNRQVRKLPVATTPKLAQFPSPQPLSEQEKILASYVANYPKHAALVAQARTEALRRDREEMSAPVSGSDESSQQRIQ